MANSYVSYPGNGIVDTFSVSFPFLSKAHVKVYVGGVEVTTFTWPTTSTIKTPSVPANGVTVLIKRVTPTTPEVDFVDGSTLTESLLDTSTIQSLYVAEESADTLNGLINLDLNDNKFDGQSKVIKNVADPVNPQDVATKHWSETSVSSSVAQAANSAAAAANSATNASSSATTAATQASSATSSATTATGAAASATTSKTAAEASETNAGISASSAAAAATTAIAKASEASASATAAAASASTASTQATSAASSAAASALSATQAATYSATFRTSDTGSTSLPVGTSAQRDASPLKGYIRFNDTIGQFEGFYGAAWGSIGGGATGGGSDQVFVLNSRVVTTSYSIPSGKSALSAGPITVNSGVSVTIPSGSKWVIL